MSRAEICRENGNLGGRPKGSLNKVTLEVMAAVRLAAPEALEELVRLAKRAESEQVRIAAIKEILDREYGKSPQPISGDDQGGPVIVNVITKVQLYDGN